MQKTLVLASASPYRRELLSRLQMPFITAAPNVDETPYADESPSQTAMRLAQAKAQAVAQQHPHALIIGSDQVATFEGQKIGKPHTYERAVAQLQAMRGKTVVFHSALCVLDACTGRLASVDVPTQVRFRPLTDQQIINYVQREQPYDCAGSAKSEGLGIALIAAIEGDDPNALIGLPLIALVSLLNEMGMDVLA